MNTLNTKTADRNAMHHRLFGAVLAGLLGLTGPALAQDSIYGSGDGDGYDDGYDDADGNGDSGYEGGGISADRMEAECQATARPEICLSYFQFNCQYYGFPQACAMASLGSNCYEGGDPGQCQHFVGLLQANTACIFGDQGACAWVSQQTGMLQ